MPMQWKDDFLVNVSEVDTQHKKLVSLVVELDTAMRQGKGRDVLGKILASLVQYTQYHFGTEERLMAAKGYPVQATHIEEHRKLTKTVVDFKTQFDKGSVAVTVQVMTFLEDWLVNHIQKTDKLLGRHLNSVGMS
jgi:hemerythrin-like metal-binding protein